MNLDQRVGGGHSPEVEMTEPERAAQALEALMLREGAAMGRSQFIESVAKAYKNARRNLGHDSYAPQFLHEPSHRVFEAALRHAADMLPETASVLVLGCGDSYLGGDASYAMETVRRVIGEKQIRLACCLNLSRAGPLEQGQWQSDGVYDLLVSHSFLHFIQDLAPVLRLVVRSVSSAGYYLMAHEPNSRFWRNPKLLAARKGMIQSRARRNRWTKWFRPHCYKDKLQSAFGQRRPDGLEVNVNKSLVQRYGLKGGLSLREIVQLADPHRPSEAPGEFRLGLSGLDGKSLADTGFSDMSLVWQRTYEHLGPTDYTAMGGRWRRVNKELEACYPLDGAYWTALWSTPR
jgi:SAM-dependent methyltransferase